MQRSGPRLGRLPVPLPTGSPFPLISSLFIFSGCKAITDEGIRVVAASCPNLEFLDLTRSAAPPLPRPNFKDHSIGQTPLRCFQLTDASACAVAEGCQRLKSFNLYACSSFTDEALVALSGGCPDLEMLDVCGSGEVSAQALFRASKAAYAAAQPLQGKTAGQHGTSSHVPSPNPRKANVMHSGSRHAGPLPGFTPNLQSNLWTTTIPSPPPKDSRELITHKPCGGAAH